MFTGMLSSLENLFLAAPGGIENVENHMVLQVLSDVREKVHCDSAVVGSILNLEPD